jgi:hypothetical protein
VSGVVNSIAPNRELGLCGMILYCAERDSPERQATSLRHRSVVSICIVTVHVLDVRCGGFAAHFQFPQVDLACTMTDKKQLHQSRWRVAPFHITIGMIWR